MATEYATKSNLLFEPGTSGSFATDEPGEAYVTPETHRETLGDLARLTYLSGRLRYRLTCTDGGGKALVRLTDGSQLIASDEIDLQAGDNHGDLFAAVDQVNGGAALRVEVEITEAQPQDATATLAAALVVTHPLIIGA